MTPATPDARPLRADAQRNLERVLRAAQDVFAEQGIEAGIPEIAARAGVGKATIYRSFPAKEDLVAAVVVQRLETFLAEIRAALADDRGDAWATFRRLLADGAERQSRDRALTDSFDWVADRPEVAAARAAVFAQLDRLMDRAKEQGAMRADVTSDDVRVLFAGAARVLTGEGVHDVAAWRRFAGLVADAMRA